jgi:Transposase DDE domain
MRPARQSIPRRSAAATRHLRATLTAWLSAAVRLPPRRRKCAPAVVWRALLWAAAFARSLAAACQAIPGAPTGQAVWDALRPALPKRRRTLERRLLAALHAPLPPRPRAARVAIDYHRIPYYGTPGRDTTRAKRSAGTHNFHTYATACVVGGPDRYTVGLTAVADREPMTHVLARLLDQVAVAGVPVRVVLLDRAFFSIAVMRLLQSRRLPFVLPAVIRGRKPRPGVPAAGLRAIRRRGAGRYPYTHEDRGQSVRVVVVVAHKSYRHARTGRRHTRKLLYLAWRVPGGPVAVRDLYRLRFGIESSYRQLGEARPRTSCRDGVVRLLWVAVGLVVRNAWVWACRAEPRGWSLAAVRLILLLDILVVAGHSTAPATAGPDPLTTPT